MKLAIIVDLENTKISEESIRYLSTKLEELEIPIGLSFEPVKSKSILKYFKKLKSNNLVEFIPTTPYRSNLNFMNNKEAHLALSIARDIVKQVIGIEPKLLMFYHQLIVDPDQLEIAKEVGYEGAIVSYEAYRYIIPQLHSFKILRTLFNNSEFLLIYAQKHIPRTQDSLDKVVLIFNAKDFLENIEYLSKKFNIESLDKFLREPKGRIDLFSMGTMLFGKEYCETSTGIREIELLRILSRIRESRKQREGVERINKLIMKILSKDYKLIILPSRVQNSKKEKRIEIINSGIELSTPFISEVRFIDVDEALAKTLAFVSRNEIVGDFLRIERVKSHNIGIASVVIPKYGARNVIEVKSVNQNIEPQVHVISDWLFTNSTEIRLSNAGLPLSIKAGPAFIDLGREAFYTLIIDESGSEFSETDVSITDHRYGRSFLGLTAWSCRKSGVGDAFIETEMRLYSKVPVVEVVKRINLLTEFSGWIHTLTIPIPPYLTSIIRLSCKGVSSIRITSAEAIIPTLNSVAIDMGYGYLAVVSNVYTEPSWSLYVNKAKGYLSMGIFRGSFQNPLTGVKYVKFFIYTASTLEEVKNFINAYTNPPLIKPVPRSGIIDLYISHTPFHR